MYCRFCGARINEDSKFCPYCGKDLKMPEDNSLGQEQHDSSEAVPADHLQPAAGIQKSVILKIGIAAAVVAVGGAGVYIWHQHVDNSSEAPAIAAADNTQDSPLNMTDSTESSPQDITGHFEDSEREESVENNTAESSDSTLHPAGASDTPEVSLTTDEQLEMTLREDLLPAYGKVSDFTMESPCWMERHETEGTSYYSVQSGSFSGENGVYQTAILDLDQDGDDELLFFDRTQEDLNRVPTGEAGTFHAWHFYMGVCDIIDGNAVINEPIEIKSIGQGSDLYDGSGFLTSYGLAVYTKNTASGIEIFTLNYDSNYPNADGISEKLSAYQYQDNHVTKAGNVEFNGSDDYGIGEDADFVSGMRSLGLTVSADQIQQNDYLFGESDHTPGLLFGLISPDEPNIDMLFTIYTTSDFDISAWSDAVMNNSTDQFDCSHYTSTLHCSPK